MKFKVYQGNICVYEGYYVDVAREFRVSDGFPDIFEMAAEQYHIIEGWRFDWPVEVEIDGERKIVNREVKYSFKVEKQ